MIVPDYVEPVVGWRVWYAVDGGLSTSLTSVVHRASWPRRTPLVASCRRLRTALWPFNRSRHDAPAEGCSCGIYAGTVETLRIYLPEHFGFRAVPVVGRVSLWGVVHEHELGWRASHAYPETLYVPTPHLGSRAEGILRELRGYGVPVYAVHATSAEGVLDAVTSRRAA